MSFLLRVVSSKRLFLKKWKSGWEGVLELGNPGGRGVLTVWEIQSGGGGGGQKCLPSVGRGVFFLE